MNKTAKEILVDVGFKLENRKVRFMKHWQLSFILEDGRRWSGWICMDPSNPEDENSFPETVTGIFWIMQDEIGFHGFFELGDGVYGKNYVHSAGMKNHKTEIEHFTDAESYRAYVDAEQVLSTFERIEKKIEDCLNVEDSYVSKY